MNVLKKELIEAGCIFKQNKGIVAYVTTIALFCFALSLLKGNTAYSIAYLVCILGSLVNLIPLARHPDEIRTNLRKIFYVIAITIVSLGFVTI